MTDLRITLPDFDGRAPLLPADTPEFVLDAAPSWAACAELEFDKKTGYFDVGFSGHKQGAVGKGITTQLRQFVTVDPADGRTVKRDDLVIGLDYPTGSWIDIDPDDLAEVQRALHLAELDLTSVDCTPHQTDDGWMDETGKIWPSKSAYYEALSELQESAAQFIADVHGSEPK